MKNMKKIEKVEKVDSFKTTKQLGNKKKIKITQKILAKKVSNR